MAEKISRVQHRIGEMKITICHFQKNEGMLKTGIQSTTEVDYEVSQINMQFAKVYFHVICM